MAKPNEMNITAVAWHDSVLPQPLTFAPPFAWKATNPAGFSRFWQFASYAFGLANPARFPRLAGITDEAGLRVGRRFLQSAEELASYTIMSASDRVEMTVDHGNETWVSEFSSSEVIRGAATLFRQLDTNSDPSGYPVLVKILSRLVHERVDEHTEQRLDMLTAWRRAYGRLKQQRIEAIVGRMAANAYAGTANRAPVPFEDVRPTQIIDRYFNGDLIHWDRRAEELEAFRAKDQVFADLDKLHFLEAMCGLGHFYFGFSVLGATALGIEIPQPS